MRTQSLRTRRGNAKLGAHLGPKQPRRTQLGHLQVEVGADSKKEAEASAEHVQVHAPLLGVLDICARIEQGKRQFQRGVGTGFLQVVTGH
ncbi:hypothetical protein D9M68_791550 [compost metagenome]